MSCKICNSTDATKFKFGSIGLVKCNNCDITFLEHFPDNKILETLYKDNYSISTNNSDAELRRSVQQIENYHIFNIINKFNPNGNKLIDIGCDKGFFIDEARRNNFEVFGVELNKNSQSYCYNIGLDVRQNIEDFDLVFDLITMNHSLEHFTNPNEYLIKLKDYLVENGLLVIRVPAFDSVWSKIIKNKWIWFQADNHYFHYSINSMKYLLEKNKFEVMDIYHSNPSKLTHYLKYLISRIEFSKSGLIPFDLKIILTQALKNITATEIFAIAKNIK